MILLTAELTGQIAIFKKYLSTSFTTSIRIFSFFFLKIECWKYAFLFLRIIINVSNILDQ